MAHVVRDSGHVICAFIGTPSFSVISDHKGLFVVLIGVMCWGPGKRTQISVQEVYWSLPLGRSPVRGDRSSMGQREKGGAAKQLQQRHQTIL